MTLGLVGKKCGMTRIFSEDGTSTPVTVLAFDNVRVTQVKKVDTDGYTAVQVTAGRKKASHVNKPSAGHYAKSKVEAGEGLWEFRVCEKELNVAAGDTLSVDMFEVGQMVDVTSTSKGKGWAGVIKRHHFNSQDATHGNSLSHRAPGSIGQRQTPGRVFKGMRMAGHLGDARVTIQNQAVVRIDKERNLILIRGAVPGAPGAEVIIKPTVRTRKKKGGK
jgi:large subunit ribosomal protein L3